MTAREDLPPIAAELLITCEHGGNKVPAAYRPLFNHCRNLLSSHRGFDPGALVMACALAMHFNAPLVASMVSRLVVDLNRSIGHKHLHADFVRTLPAATRQEIIERYYLPYRQETEQRVVEGIARRGMVIHISCHSFTNNFNGVVRDTDIGLLYDPARRGERALCAHWKDILNTTAPGLEVRRNYPYEGRNDGLTSALRKKFPPDAYLGIELELNQKELLRPTRQWKALRESVIASLSTLLRDHDLTTQLQYHHYREGMPQ